MRFYFFLVLFALKAFTSLAQTKFTLTGSIEMQTGEVFPFKIVFSESGGVVKGYSITYKDPDDTKAIIEGTLDRHNRKLNFHETEIVYSHGYHTQAFMCLVDARTSYAQGVNGKILRGPITGSEADKTACTGGTLTFNDPQEVKKIFEQTEQFDTVISMKKRVKEPGPEKAAPTEPEKEPVTEKITTGIEKAYEWHSDTVVIDIWDGGNTDGDKISLLYNGKQWLAGYQLVKQRKQLRIPVSAIGTDVIVIIAENEGSDPPNTATLMLRDGATRYSIEAYNNKGQQALIRIRKAK